MGFLHEIWLTFSILKFVLDMKYIIVVFFILFLDSKLMILNFFFQRSQVTHERRPKPLIMDRFEIYNLNFDGLNTIELLINTRDQNITLFHGSGYKIVNCKVMKEIESLLEH